MELSQNIEDEQGLKRELARMGVEDIPDVPGIDGNRSAEADD
jgi:DNA-directed RNA polymerase subunit B"